MGGVEFLAESRDGKGRERELNFVGSKAVSGLCVGRAAHVARCELDGPFGLGPCKFGRNKSTLHSLYFEFLNFFLLIFAEIIYRCKKLQK